MESLPGLKKQSVMKPADCVIAKIKELITSGVLKPGDRLPAERKMAEEFGFGRTQVRDALRKLEFYGIIRTLPKSGSIIYSLDINTLDGLISDVLNLQDYDFYSLVETRFILECNAIRLCAERRSEENLRAIEKAYKDFIKYEDTPERVNYDFIFHRTIAEACHNPVLKAMLLIVTPEIMTIYQQEKICTSDDQPATDEHKQMLDCIRSHDGEEAVAIMQRHLEGVLEFAKSKL
jgi:GntR family transcriptional repressor for pyruvate dehydrogenase complex